MKELYEEIINFEIKKSNVSNLCIYEESIGIQKIFDFQLLTDLHALRCFEHDFTIFAKCLSVCHTNFVVVLEQKLIS